MGNAKPHEAPVPHKAIDFLEKKITVETEKWDDLKWGEHAHAFTVAHSAGAGVLDEIFKSMDKAIEEGESFQTFRQRMLDTMKEKGWYGGAGHRAKEKRYINWRIGVIYDTNIRTAYAQANYREQLAGAALRPIWVYQSQLTGGNRRQEHIALHGKALRYDDPFWDTYYPPNGWGCECYVITESEYSAKKAGITVETSKDMTLPEIDETWAYNVGREALAPNFNKYPMLKKYPELRQQIMKQYRQSMDCTVLTKEQWQIIAYRTNEVDYKPSGIMYQIGNLDDEDYKAVHYKTGVFDSKVMATDHDLWHSMGHKQKRIQDAKSAKKPHDEIQRLINQAVDVKDFEAVYKTYSEPEHIFKETVTNKKERYMLLHFTQNMGKGKTLRIVFRARYMPEGKLYTAMQLVSMGIVESMEYRKGRYENIK